MPPVAATLPTAKPALVTAEEFWDFIHLPENEDRHFELIRGVIVEEGIEMPSPNRKHGRICSRICQVLENWLDTHNKGYIASNDSGVILEYDPDSVVGPDVAYYTDANSWDDMPEKWGDVAPVLAVEVLSPNDRYAEVNAKVQAYLDAGSKLVWVVDGDLRTVTVYRPKRRHEVVSITGELEGGKALPGFRCKLTDIFRMPKS